VQEGRDQRIVQHQKNDHTESTQKKVDQYLEAAEYIKSKYPNTVFHVCGFCEQAYEEKLKELTVSIKAQGGADGRTYGAVTVKDIAEALEKQHKIKVDRRKITLEFPIRAFGVYILEVKLYADVIGKITVSVTQ
jgi:large subunit ribosomal protein L9